MLGWTTIASNRFKITKQKWCMREKKPESIGVIFPGEAADCGRPGPRGKVVAAFQVGLPTACTQQCRVKKPRKTNGYSPLKRGHDSIGNTSEPIYWLLRGHVSFPGSRYFEDCGELWLRGVLRHTGYFSREVFTPSFQLKINFEMIIIMKSTKYIL